ncbi:MAG: hypothetical protein HKP35_03320 [Silicimonas sp.]|nr:hypothetical protein [Silicimonas sp.]
MKTLIAGTAFALGGLAAAMTATAAFAEARPLISEADVKVELDDVNANALQYFPDIEKDLEAKLAEAIEPYYSGDGYEITVSLSEISVDGSVLLGNDELFNTLKGWVYIREQGNPDPVDSVGLSLTAVTGEVDASATENTIVIPPAQNAFYDALLSRFAERTIEEVEGL